MRRHYLFLFLLCIFLLAGCGRKEEISSLKRYEASFLTLFDTVTTIVGYTEREEDFADIAQQIHDELEIYHQLFDIYNDYPGVNNLKTINDHAGLEPVVADERLIDLLSFCRDVYDRTDGVVNVAMGSVLANWHDARSAGLDDPEAAVLPDWKALQEAAAHTNMDAVIIDRKTSSIYISDPEVRLDVGAVAKGYAVERVCQNAPAGLMISVGGNVRATGAKPGSHAPWIVGIQDPDGGDKFLHKVSVTEESVVTSGDYQRYYTVDGVRYHHIIDPDTWMPAKHWRSVTILCEDSGAADALSTALFLLPNEEGQRLLEDFNAEAMWVDLSGTEYFSPGFSDYMRN